MFNKTVDFIRSIYDTDDFIPLHEPRFSGNEKQYLNECIDSTFVSSVGKYVENFEKGIADFTGAKYAVATGTGTSALHIALVVTGVKKEDEVLTQALSFVATANAIAYIGAEPIFLDSDESTLGMSVKALKDFLVQKTVIKDGKCFNKETNRRISACVPMHVFGHAVEIEAIAKLCQEYYIPLVEDAAESLGGYYKGKHTGTLGKIAAFSFNGNKVITTGGGGMIVTNDELLAKHAKHLTTTAKIPHKWEYVHDEIGYNYRMPNLNAALGCAQLENLETFLAKKRVLAMRYQEFFNNLGIEFFAEAEATESNYWLNAILLKNREDRDKFLEHTNSKGIMTRPVWQLLSTLPMFKSCQNDGNPVAEALSERIVNIPSSVI